MNMIIDILILMLGIAVLVAPMVMADALDPRNRRRR